MSDMNRVQRWRQQQREAGKDALTIWLPRELKLYVEDMALKRHCSPSDLVEQALTTCYPQSADVTVTVTDTPVTDTSQLRRMLQQELRAFFAHTEGVLEAIREGEAARAAADYDEAHEHILTHTAQEHDEWLAEMHKQGRLLEVPLAAAETKAAAKKPTARTTKGRK